MVEESAFENKSASTASASVESKNLITPVAGAMPLAGAIVFLWFSPGVYQIVKAIHVQPRSHGLVAECANDLWKKVQRGELNGDEALMAGRVLERADINLYTTRHLLEASIRVPLHYSHPAYDCVYLTLALANGWRLVRKLCASAPADQSSPVVSLRDAVASNGL